jgi:general stress protein YciG
LVVSSHEGHLEVFNHNNTMATEDRGFASMDPEKRREIASKGGKESGGNFKNDPERASEAGKAAHQKGTAHEFNSEEARDAGQKGGSASRSIDDDDMMDM